jgi:hypothetical protein
MHTIYHFFYQQKMSFFLMFARVPKIIDDLLSDVITKDAIKKFIKQQFMNIKNKIALNTNKVIQK